MRKTIFLLLALFAVSHFITPQTGFAWDSTAAKYYPLKIGNSYVYEKYHYMVKCYQQYAGKMKIKIIRDTVLSNGKRYYEFQGGLSPYWKYQRIDSSSMNLYGYDQGEDKEYLFDSLAANVGNHFQSYRFQSYLSNNVYNGTLTMNVLGSNRSVKGYANGSNGSATAFLYYFAEGIGPLGYSYCLDWGEGVYLNGCVINGVVYGDTIMTAVTQISTEVPDNFLLKQNYPNPFNPTTKINYQLKNADFVTHKVFDVMGKEVSTLVKENQKAGSYEVTFDAAALPAGVYYYRLIVNGFSEVKKMSLVK